MRRTFDALFLSRRVLRGRRGTHLRRVLRIWLASVGVTALVSVDSESLACDSEIERFGERLLALDETRIVIASPFARDGAGWCAVVDMETCEVLQYWEGAIESNLGWSLGKGDFDGDGCVDLVLGAPGTVTGTVAGEVQLLRGTGSGWEAWRRLGEFRPGERFGESVLVFDPDGDGNLDLAVGAGTYTGQWTYEGAVRLFRSFGAGLEESPSWLQTGRSVGAGFGRALSSGDFDGDGRDDLLVGSPEGSWGQAREGRAEIFLGGGGGGLAGLPSWSVEGGEAYAYFGLSVAVFPVSGNGRAAGTNLAWAVGAPGTDGGRGRVDLYRGPGLPAVPSASRRETATGAWFGTVLAPTWTPGRSAIAVGAPGAEGGSGCVHVVAWNRCQDAFTWTGATSGVEGARLGSALSAAEGVLWMGAPWETTPEGIGSVHLWRGPDAGSLAQLARPCEGGGPPWPGRPDGTPVRNWRVSLAPQPIGLDTQVRVLGDPPCVLDWECVGPDGRRLAAGSLGSSDSLPWENLWSGSAVRPVTGWLVVSDGIARDVVRWVDLAQRGR